jgi:hypothetical protein
VLDSDEMDDVHNLGVCKGKEWCLLQGSRGVPRVRFLEYAWCCYTELVLQALDSTSKLWRLSCIIVNATLPLNFCSVITHAEEVGNGEHIATHQSMGRMYCGKWITTSRADMKTDLPCTARTLRNVRKRVMNTAHNSTIPFGREATQSRPMNIRKYTKLDY